MLDLPYPILDYLYKLTIQNRSPAYLFVEKNGCLSNWGGNLAAYGVSGLQKGKYIGEQVFFLESLFPLDGSSIFLPCIKTENGCSADVHIFPGDEGDWVLLLDATLEEIQRRLIQQQGNDLSLLREQQARILNQYFEKDAIESLAPAVLSLEAKGKRRDVNIFFAHICGLTFYSENNCSNIVFRKLNLCLPAIFQPILDQASLVDKMIGDVITAFFGLLPSTGSFRHQAIKAALRMIEAVRDVGQTWQADNWSALNIRIGIASGPVALGILGSKARRTFNAIGYYVNLAARVESQARPREMLIDDNTFQKIDRLQEKFSESTLSLTGIVETIKIYSCLVKL